MKYFTLDLEEWWGVESFKPFFKNHPIPEDDRIDSGLNDFLHLLNKYNQKGTFFILGRVAQKYPELVPLLQEQGHTIATHGFNHELIYKQSPEEFELDLVASIEVLSKQTGKEITAYRAPSYSITSKSLWALEILRKNGITIDSSISPASNKRFGINGAPEHAYAISTQYGMIKEVPPNMIKLGLKLPITSGIGFRLFPKSFIQRSIKLFDSSGIDTMFIFHNWEMDKNQPKIDAGWKAKFIHYYGIDRMESKLDSFFKQHRFDPISEGIEGLPTYKIENGNLERTV